MYLYDIRMLAEKLTGEFGAIPYEKFAEDTKKIESAVQRLVIMHERWAWLPRQVRQMLVPVDWHAVIGRWDRNVGRHVGVDSKKLWETIVQKLPEMNKKTEELLKRQS